MPFPDNPNNDDIHTEGNTRFRYIAAYNTWQPEDLDEIGRGVTLPANGDVYKLFVRTSSGGGLPDGLYRWDTSNQWVQL